MRYQEVLPPGWANELYHRVDFEDSFQKLRGVKHFFGATMRGFIRSQQLRPKAAWPHFRRAFERASKVEETIPNLVRQFLTSVLCIENALLEGSVKPGTELPPPWFPELPEEILEEYPEVRTVLTQRKSTEASLRLHTADYEGAAELFGELIEDCDASDKPDYYAGYCLGLSASLYNMGYEDEAAKKLEAAAIATQVGGSILTSLRNGVTLSVFHDYIGSGGEGKEWREFVGALPCPDVSKELFFRRAERMMKRCQRRASLLFF